MPSRDGGRDLALIEPLQGRIEIPLQLVLALLGIADGVVPFHFGHAVQLMVPEPVEVEPLLIAKIKRSSSDSGSG